MRKKKEEIDDKIWEYKKYINKWSGKLSTEIIDCILMEKMKWSYKDLMECDDFYYNLLIEKISADNEYQKKEKEKERKKTK